MSDAIVRLSPAEKSKRINDLHRGTRHRPGKKVPVTGRSARYYQRALYPDRDMLPAIRARGGRLLDLGSGCNHLHPSSLLRKMRRRGPAALGLDMEDRLEPSHQYRVGSVFRTGLPGGRFGTILSNNVLYYWIDTKKDLLRAYREMLRLLRPGGEIRVFPVFYGQYHANSPELYQFLHRHFWVRLLTPRYSSESPLMLFDGRVQQADRSVGAGEARMMRRLHAQTLILRRVD